MSDNSFEKAWRMAYPNGEYCPESRDFCDDQMVIDLAEAYDKITRLTAELEQARNNYDSAVCGRSEMRDGLRAWKDRAEAAEQQMAALVKTLKRIMTISLPAGRNSIYSIAYDALSTLPDRAKKIRAVVSSAEKQYNLHNSVARILQDDGKCQCDICRAVRDLKETP